MPEGVGLLDGERRDWLQDRDEDLLPGARQLLEVLSLGERKTLERRSWMLEYHSGQIFNNKG